MKIFKHLFLFFAFVLNANLATAWEDMPSADKEAIQKILKKATSEELKIDIKDILLAPLFMKKSNDWIFTSLDIQDITGKSFEYPEGHDLYEYQNIDMVSNKIYALLRKNNGNWELIDIVVNDSDPVLIHWAEKYHAPKHLFYTVCLDPESARCRRLDRIITPWRGTWHPPIEHNGRSIESQEPSFIIQDQKIIWKWCGTEARKVKVYSKFHSITSGILLAIEGEPCINEEKGHSISYIHVESVRDEEHDNRLCVARITVYESSSTAAYANANHYYSNKHLDRKIYTNSFCSTSKLSERITEATARLLKIKKAKLQLVGYRLEAVGDWLFITAGTLIDSKDKMITTVPDSAVTHIISVLLKRNGPIWDLVEIDASTEENKALFPKWIQTHRIPQDGKKISICPDTCPE